ncbi:MAG: hypothetical protein JXA11_03340 [Phycisphaerae bacterium]|nr:hypothetical protein [Phycisphaerae bacterium]
MNHLQKTYLFLDARHIQPGCVRWTRSDGTPLPLIAPPEPFERAVAKVAGAPRGIRLQAQPCRKTGPLPIFMDLATVIFENGVYRSWVITPQYPPGRNYGCYSKEPVSSLEIVHLESRDGFDWRQTHRSEIEHRGQTGFDGFSVFRDPVAPDSERYKAVFMALPPEADWPALWADYRRLPDFNRDMRLGVRDPSDTTGLGGSEIDCLYGAVSPDGLHWTRLPGHLAVHKSDTDTTVYHDVDRGKYVMYTRLFKQSRRWIGRMESDDFRRWSPVEPLLLPELDGSLCDDLYMNCRTTVPGLDAYHLMFPEVYHRDTEGSDVHLYSSQDGVGWLRVPGGPVLSPGDDGAWDGCYLYAKGHMVPWQTNGLALHYHATPYPHKYPRWKEVLQTHRVGWAYWPEGRLCAAVADEDGEFSTHGIVPAGSELRLNVRCQPEGSVRVEIMNAESPAGVSDTITGDHPAAPVVWQGRSSVFTPESKAVVLRFTLHRAELFGFQWI